ncbi:MAG: phage tail sheath family protein [Oscillospiraceae bacterium]
MALGGGNFTAQNKALPGAYINFVSAAKASANLSDRGVATMPLELDWGADGRVFEVSQSDFINNSIKLFGYEHTHEKLKGIRDIFRNARILYAYRLNTGVKAANALATALYSGIRGNDLKVTIQKNVNDNAKFDVSLFLGTVPVDMQTVTTSAELKDNAFAVWKKDAVLAVTAAAALTGGTNGTVDAAAHQGYLDKIEAYAFNTMGVTTIEDAVKQLYVNFCKRLRDTVGSKFQLVVHGKAADYEGVINVKNSTTDSNFPVSSLVYWVTGLNAACEINKSCLNHKYDGEFLAACDYTQAQLETAIKSGEFTLHKVGSDVRVLDDINSLVSVSEVKGELFKDNQTIRVVDQIANDIAVLFNTKYLGKIPNDASGRISLWTDIVKHHEQLQSIRAIENFSDKDVVVNLGDTKKAVVITDAVTIVNSMSQLYMTVTIA